MIFARVVLPAPEAPTTPVIVPAATVSETPSNTGRGASG